MSHLRAGGHGQGHSQPPVYKYRGQALIIVNENFKKVNGVTDPALKRDGASSDLNNMKALFKALDFKVSAYKDLTGSQMKEKLHKACNDRRNRQSQCFALVISSHGREYKESDRKQNGSEDAPVFCQYLYGSDCEMVRLNDVITMFSQETTLMEKPKLFFIQACRIKQFNSQDMLDTGVDINVAGSSAGSQPSYAGGTIDETLIQLVEHFQQQSFDIYTDWNDEQQCMQSSDKGDGSPQPKRRRLCSEDEIMDVEEEQIDADPVPPRAETESPDQPAETPAMAENIRRGPQMVPAEPEDAQPDSRADAEEQHTSAQEQMPEPQLVVRGQGTQLIDSRSAEDAEAAEARSTQPSDKRNGNDMTDAQPVPPREQSEPPRQVSVHMTRELPPEVPPEQAGGSRGTRTTLTTVRKPDSFGVNTLPDDFLIVYPTMSGKAAFRNADIGSRLLHCMCKMQHVKLLLNGRNILQYLTSVSRDLAAAEITYDNISCKACVCVQHTLCEKLRFLPIRNDSLMARVKTHSS